jgi:hypothetical protein
MTPVFSVPHILSITLYFYQHQLAISPCTPTNTNSLYLPVLLPTPTRSIRTAAIQQRLTSVLWSIPKEAFADSFQKL